MLIPPPFQMLSRSHIQSNLLSSCIQCPSSYLFKAFDITNCNSTHSYLFLFFPFFTVHSPNFIPSNPQRCYIRLLKSKLLTGCHYISCRCWRHPQILEKLSDFFFRLVHPHTAAQVGAQFCHFWPKFLAQNMERAQFELPLGRGRPYSDDNARKLPDIHRMSW